MMAVIGLLACAPKYPGPPAPDRLARWNDSLRAIPEAREVRSGTGWFREKGATPPTSLDLYERASADPMQGPVERGAIVCRVSAVEARDALGPEPDLLVVVESDGRRTELGYADQDSFEFTVGLVDLEPGQRIEATVLEDRLGGRDVLLEGQVNYNGTSPWGWTERVDTRRVSLRCFVPSTQVLERSIDERLDAAWRAIRRQDRDGPEPARRAIRALAALVGWSDPRVEDLIGRL